MKPSFVAGFAPIVRDAAASKAFWGDALGIARQDLDTVALRPALPASPSTPASSIATSTGLTRLTSVSTPTTETIATTSSTAILARSVFTGPRPSHRPLP